MKIYQLPLLTAIVLLVTATSCATLISGTHQQVSIRTNEAGARVIIDEDLEIAGGEAVKLKRKENHTLLAQLDGFESEEYQLKSKTNPWIWANFVWWPVITAYGAVLMSRTETVTDYYYMGTQRYESSYSQPKEPDFTIGLTAISTGWLIPMLPLTIDIISGASKKFAPEVELGLHKLPEPLDPKNTLITRVETVNMKLAPGSVVGSIKNKKGVTTSDLKWDQTVNVAFEDLIIQANNNLNEFGCNIPGLRNIKEEMIKDGRESYIIEAEIKDMQYNIQYLTVSEAKTSCEIKVTWRLIHPRTKDVVYFTDITTAGTAQENGGAVPVYRALRYNIFKLIDDPEFRKLMSKGSGSGVALPEQSIPGEQPVGVDLTLLSSDRTNTYNVTQVAATAKSAVVTIVSPSGHGSGFLVSADGYLLTNAHVVEGFNELSVKFSNGFSFTPEIIAIDNESDLALLKIPGNGYSFLTLHPQTPELGEDIMVIGTPAQEDLSQSITRGVVSGVRLIEGKKLIQTDAGISPGNSGGPMLDMHGQVVGIVTSKISGGGVEGIGFGIPVSVALEKLGIDFR